MRSRQSLAVVAAGLVTGLIVITIAIGDGGRATQPSVSRRQPRARLGSLTSPAATFVSDPYMGVACPLANSIACDRVGLAVWLRAPASVSATIAGAPLTLNDPHWSYVEHDGRHRVYVYAGFLEPAGLRTRLHVVPESSRSMWFGGNPRSPLVRFRIDYGHGHVAFTEEHVSISTGLG